MTKLSSKVVSSIVLFTLLAAPFIETVIAPSGTGVLSEVDWWNGFSWVPVAKDGQGAFPVNPGETYRVNITGITEVTGSTTVWIKGSLQDTTPWQIILTDQSISSGTLISSGFTIPEDAGCTAVVAYDRVSLMAAESEGSNKPGHLKTYDSNGVPIPCEGTKVPEFPVGTEMITAFTLIGIIAIRLKKK